MLKQVMLIAMLVCCSQAQAGVYKWKDTDGRIHYSATPPMTGEYENLAKPPPPSHDPEAAMQELRNQVEAAEKTGEEIEQQNRAIQAAKDQESRRVENCQRAKANLEALESKKDIIQTGADGSKVLLNEQQRQQVLAQTRKDVDYFCNP